MLLSAVLLFSVLIFIPHFPFGAHAKLYVDCTFERIKSWTTAQNTSAPSLRFRGQFPSSKKSHTCLVKTNETNRLIYLKAKKDEWSNGESEFSFISMIKLLSFPININFTSFLCGSPPLFRPLNHFFFAGRSREEFRIRISGIQKNITAMHAAQLLSYGSMKMIKYSITSILFTDTVKKFRSVRELNP